MTECWIWPGKPGGYGQIRVGDREYYVHRLSWTEWTGQIPDELDHLCLNKRCYNPQHLEDVGHAENVRRFHALRTACPKGHLYDEKNTYREKVTGYRHCRRCHNEGQQARDRRIGRRR